MKTEDEDEELHYIKGYNEARNFYVAALDAKKSRKPHFAKPHRSLEGWHNGRQRPYRKR